MLQRIRVTDKQAMAVMGVSWLGLMGAVVVGWPVAGMVAVFAVLSSVTQEPKRGKGETN